MTKYYQGAAAAVALMLVAAGAIFLFAPTDALQGSVQRIFTCMSARRLQPSVALASCWWGA